ncbi:MAG: DUF5788 family protein [Methanomassiliicoccales archaeon]|jgi:hypothetical protein
MTEGEKVGDGSEYLSESERRAIISRIHSLLFWVGKFIPQHEIVEGRQIDLRDVIFQFISKDNPSPEDIQGAKDLADILESKARELEKQIKDHEVTRANAYQMLDEICGLLRAVDELRNSHGNLAIYKKTALMAKVSDERRWLQFVDQLKLK